MITNELLVNRFFDGEYSGTATNMSIGETAAGGHFIMGYGHAIYAYRPPDERFGPVVFTGWKGASHSTNQHIGLMSDKTDNCFGGRPGVSDVEGDPDIEVLSSVAGNDKNYSQPQRSFRTNRGP